MSMLFFYTCNTPTIAYHTKADACHNCHMYLLSCDKRRVLLVIYDYCEKLRNSAAWRINSNTTWTQI